MIQCLPALLVRENLQRAITYAQKDEDEFVRRVMENKMALQRTA